MEPQIAIVLQETKRTLRDTQLALEDLENNDNPERRSAALRSVVVNGRAVTNVLQGLRSRVESFDRWYEPRQEDMRKDPLMRYMYQLRSKILKEGEDQTGASLYINHFSTGDIPPAPRNARAFFMGDQIGGTGWEVELGDGTVEKIYVTLPPEVGRSWLTFHGLPGEHRGEPLEDDSADYVCALYVKYLADLVRDAETEFGKNP